MLLFYYYFFLKIKIPKGLLVYVSLDKYKVNYVPIFKQN